MSEYVTTSIAFSALPFCNYGYVICCSNTPLAKFTLHFFEHLALHSPTLKYPAGDFGAEKKSTICETILLSFFISS